MQLLNNYITSDAGKAKIAQFRKNIAGKGFGGESGILSKATIQKIIRNIHKEFKKTVRETIPSFRVDSIHTHIEGYDAQGSLRANVYVDENALRRASLHYMNKNLSISHGEGVKDILALFTHGYKLNKRPYGFWVREGADPMVRIGALMQREPNPFLTELVNRLNTEYDGQCTITLNDKYKIQGGD